MQTFSDLLILDTDDLATSSLGSILLSVEAPDLATTLRSPHAYAALLDELKRYAGAPYLVDPTLQVIATVPGPVTDLPALLGFASAVANALYGAAAECSATIDGLPVEFAETSEDVFAVTVDQRQLATWYWDGDGLDPAE